MADTKKYTVHNTTIKHGRGKEVKEYAHGEEIELTDEEAAPIKHHLKEVAPHPGPLPKGEGAKKSK